MPNWCFNTVTIKGDKEEIKRVREQLSQPFSMPNRDWKTDEVTIETVNPVFAFWNIVRPPQEKYDEYHSVHGFSNGEKSGDTEYNWYNYNIRNWGTKWDVATEAFICDEDEDYVVYSFNTAWSPPAYALNALSAQYPTLVITNEWEEEQGFGSTMVHKNGEEEEFDGYDWMCGDCEFRYVGDTGAIYDEESYEVMCPKCHPEWKKPAMA